MYKAFLIDLDGTAYVGDHVIQETVDFVHRCKENSIKVLFLTNNASKTIEDIYVKLTNMGYMIEKDEIYTSAIAMVTYLKERDMDDKLYVIGDIGLKKCLRDEKVKYKENLDYNKEEDIKIINGLKGVVVGYTPTLKYTDLGVASLILQKEEAVLYGTNEDLIIPNHLGPLPGNGSIVGLLEKVTQKRAIYTGKPSEIIMLEALKKLKLTKEEVCMIGDNYKTDILSGINNNIDTIFVETGVNTLEDIEKLEKQPTYKVKNLSQWEF